MLDGSPAAGGIIWKEKMCSKQIGTRKETDMKLILWNERKKERTVINTSGLNPNTAWSTTLVLVQTLIMALCYAFNNHKGLIHAPWSPHWCSNNLCNICNSSVTEAWVWCSLRWILGGKIPDWNSLQSMIKHSSAIKEWANWINTKYSFTRVRFIFLHVYHYRLLATWQANILHSKLFFFHCLKPQLVNALG